MKTDQVEGDARLKMRVRKRNRLEKRTEGENETGRGWTRSSEHSSE